MKRTQQLLSQITEDRVRLEEDLRTRLAAMDALIGELAAELNEDARRTRRADAPARMSMSRAASYLGISKTTLYNLVRNGVIPSAVAESGRTVLRKADLDAWVASLPSGHRIRTRFPEEMVS